jgi:hypothetical protein
MDGGVEGAREILGEVEGRREGVTVGIGEEFTGEDGAYPPWIFGGRKE